MGAMKGRSVQIYRNGVLVAGARAKSISISGSPIDVTTDDDDAIRKLLDVPGQLDVTITVSGLLVNSALRDESLETSDRVKSTEFRFGGFQGSPANTNGYSGEFFMSSFSISPEYQGSVPFEATFESADRVTHVSP
jgi:predicted secreted protein